MDWDDLRVFLAVARAESLSGAGRALRLDPATVGRRIARLEAALGARLFLKSPQGYAATAEGQRLLEEAVRAEEAVQAAAGAARGDGDTLSGQVRIGAPDGCANYLLPGVVARLAAAHPALDIQIIALPRVFNLSRREADMAIAVSRPTGGRLIAEKLADYRLSLAASRGYLAGRAPIGSRADLAGHPFVGYIPDMIFDRELDYLAEVGVGRVAIASNSVAVQVNLLRAGVGVGIVHDFALPHAPDLVRLLPGEVRLTRSFWLLRHADDRRVVRLSRLAAALASELRAELDRLERLA
ncbi:MAG: LysR family transcriptional regulator [Rhodobacteraceae bacterium]|nr:LysR family transcriptional regulator [Paracoccaceae bacterium]